MAKKKDEPRDDAFDAFKRGTFDVFGHIGDVDTSAFTEEQLAVFNEQQQREYEINRAIHATFSTPDGAVTLEFIRSVALDGQRFDIGTATDAILAAAVGFFREGQAAFYFEITKRMTKAMQGPPEGAT